MLLLVVVQVEWEDMLLVQLLYKDLVVVQVDSYRDQLPRSQAQPTTSVLVAVVHMLHQPQYKAAMVLTVTLIVILLLVAAVAVDTE